MNLIIIIKIITINWYLYSGKWYNDKKIKVQNVNLECRLIILV